MKATRMSMVMILSLVLLLAFNLTVLPPNPEPEPKPRINLMLLTILLRPNQGLTSAKPISIKLSVIWIALKVPNA
ncbi:hypothetical protein HMSSN036_29880 [Paenibacillus macerans]|nr:hypothetical protein HMSSN036_29880 [Paenibacillus macerans]